MLVLSRKKIMTVLGTVFIVMLLMTITLNADNEKNNYIETVSLPVSGKIVVVDAGHGVPDEGCWKLTLTE